MTMLPIPKLVLSGLALGAVSFAAAQSCNIDLDILFGPPESGNGPPDSTYGAAAGQQAAGVWNDIYAVGPFQPHALVGLSGASTGQQFYVVGAMGAGAYNAGTSGGYQSLMNDYAGIGGTTGVQYHFTGFHAGQYLLYTYACDPRGVFSDVQVTVPGADVPLYHVTGPMQPNVYAQGITHSVHSLNLTGSSFEIDIIGPVSFTSVNGFQIVAVPEPATILLLAPAVLLMRRRRRM